MALINFPEESEKYGIGLVSKIERECGAINTKKVLEAIKEKDASLKTPIQRPQIDIIIDRHAKPKKKPSGENTVSYWKDRALRAEKGEPWR